MEITEAAFPYESHDRTFLPTSALSRGGKCIKDGLELIGRPLNREQKAQMIAAGFENVREVIYKWPVNRWPKDPKMNVLGAWTNENIGDGLHGLTTFFRRIQNWFEFT